MPVVKIYHGFGDKDHLKVFGHVFRVSPFKLQNSRKRFWTNTTSILRLFMVRPFAGVEVELAWQGRKYTTRTEADGFFNFEWKQAGALPEGWHGVTVIFYYNGIPIQGHGKIFIPTGSHLAFVSDIDDTFLVSYSSNLRRRLHVLFTKDARSRKPFEGVVRHYQLLAAGGKDKLSRPFFYVSSSEWNLYDYIREFSDAYEIPAGIYLLNQVKQLHEFLKTGQNNHNGKYVRIVRLLKAYPEKTFILFGDDSQQDPQIYYRLVKDFPGRIYCIYLRHVRKSRHTTVLELQQLMEREGNKVCYFEHSEEAIAHSAALGLIPMPEQV